MKKQRNRNLTKFTVLDQNQINIQEEARYIVRRAQDHDARIVTVTPIIFFSTETGDAWMIDPEDNLALCLARDGQEQRFKIKESETNFSIEWKNAYWIEGSVFVVSEPSGRVVSIIGYPVTEIRKAIRNMA